MPRSCTTRTELDTKRLDFDLQSVGAYPYQPSKTGTVPALQAPQMPLEYGNITSNVTDEI